MIDIAKLATEAFPGHIHADALMASAAEVLVGEFRKLHSPFTASIGIYCESCGSRYPCPTVRLADALDAACGVQP